MERAIWIYTALNLTVIGISHITAPKAWARYFVWLHGHGKAGVLIIAAMSLGFGTPIVAFHEIWSGWPLAVTLIGWAQVLKGTIYFIFPGFGLRKAKIVSEERSWIFIPAGVMLLVLSLPAWYLLIQSGWPTAP